MKSNAEREREWREGWGIECRCWCQVRPRVCTLSGCRCVLQHAHTWMGKDGETPGGIPQHAPATLTIPNTPRQSA